MKKITLLILLLTISIGYSQDLLQDFEDNNGVGAAFGGLTSATLVVDPVASGTNGTVAEIISSAAGEVWQGTNIDIDSNVLLNPTDGLTMTLDVYSETAISLLVKVTASSDGGPDSSTPVSHTGSGWETLTATFNTGSDSTAPANGTYTNFVVYPNWDSSTSYYISPTIVSTIYIDNVKGKAVVAEPDPEPTTAAPVPTTDNDVVYSIYNDTNGYTNKLNIQYGFGTASEVDLDDNTGVNNALKVNLSADGFGQGEGGPDDVSDYGFVNFHYWYSHSTGTPGFKLILIDNDGAVQEFGFQVGSTANGDGANVVSETWTLVSIPMSYFTDLGFDSTKLFQWKVDRYNQSGDNGGILYLDNIALTKDYALSKDNFDLVETTIYPNPSSDKWNISTPNTKVKSVALFSVLGKKVFSKSYDANEVSIENQSFARGIYIGRIKTELGTKNVKLIKE